MIISLNKINYSYYVYGLKIERYQLMIYYAYNIKNVFKQIWNIMKKKNKNK